MNKMAEHYINVPFEKWLFFHIAHLEEYLPTIYKV